MKADEVISKIKSGDSKYLETTYRLNRPIFMGWFKKQGLTDRDRISEWYQEAFFIFFEQVRKNHLNQLDSSVSTYLIGIGKNLKRDHRKKYWERKVEKSGSKVLQLAEEQSPLFGEIDQTDDESVQKLKAALDRLGGSCKEVLILYYYRRFSMEAIAARTGLKNENTAKKTKYECLKKLRTTYRAL